MKKIFLILFSAIAISACGNSATNSGSATKSVGSAVKPIEITESDFLTKVADYKTHTMEWKYLGDKPAIVDFYAPWCGPCKMVSPILEELAAEYGDQIVIYKVNTDNEQALAMEFGISSIPSFLFVPMSGMPEMMTGAMSKAAFVKAINDVLLKK